MVQYSRLTQLSIGVLYEARDNHQLIDILSAEFKMCQQTLERCLGAVLACWILITYIVDLSARESACSGIP